ncbi:TRAP transporter substrate-binding protein [Sulfitobacter albidus]|uniref:TRAP transporter substrate-binding protein n=1 Tax=Sulfitobacter albidus TaxID=2829501 RepID=A0A975JC89_9RHOB|nr:TRAP transporter substrate-binding protein [Sulfitobacter albidus]QUJ75817.1 TRAP transporter substrate-binding protein [Sulfitobacter albidus]
MNFTRKSVLGLIAATLLAPLPAAAQDVTLRLHQFLPDQANVPNLILYPWADRVEESSGGAIKIERYGAMQLGGRPPELMDQAIDGVADIVWTVVGYTPGRYPSTEVFELPFMMSDARAMSSAYWQMFEKHMKDTEFKDVKILGTWVHGPGLIHVDKEVQTPADMNGLKMRGGSRLANALLEKVGSSPVGMPVPAIPEALSKGVINGTTIPWEVTGALKIPELVDYHTEFEGNALYTLTFVLAMNKDRYDSLTPEQQKALDDNSGLDFSILAGGTMQDADAPARQAAVDAGNTITTVSGDAVEAWRTAAQPVYDEWLADMESKGIDGQALIDEAKSLMDAYEN